LKIKQKIARRSGRAKGSMTMTILATNDHSRNSATRSDQRSYQVLKLAASQFDYSSISPSLVPNLQAQAKLIRSMIASTTAALIEVGRNLLAAKEHLDHGQFIGWLETEVGIGKRTAQRYMALADFAETKSDTLSLLPPSTAHRLVAASAPREVVNHVLEQATAGVIVPDSAVAEMVREAKSQRSLAKKKERAASRRSRAYREKEDRRRREREEEELLRQQKAEATAQALVGEIGIPTIKRISDALNDCYVGRAVAKLIALEAAVP
jgi:hypothetical protein